MTQGTGPDWRLREAGPGDADALALVGAASFLESFAGVIEGAAIIAHCAGVHTPAAYRDALGGVEDGGGRAWLALAEPGGAPIGYALACPPDLPGARAGDVELKRIYALARWHGSGLGPALLDRVIAAFADAPRLVLGVYRGNARAIAFYRKHGFDEIGTRRFDVGGTLYDDVVLARPMRVAGEVSPRVLAGETT